MASKGTCSSKPLSGLTHLLRQRQRCGWNPCAPSVVSTITTRARTPHPTRTVFPPREALPTCAQPVCTGQSTEPRVDGHPSTDGPLAYQPLPSHCHTSAQGSTLASCFPGLKPGMIFFCLSNPRYHPSLVGLVCAGCLSSPVGCLVLQWLTLTFPAST